MKQQIEGLYLSAQNYTGSSVIVHLFTRKYGRQSFIFKGAKKKNKPFIFQPFHFIEFSTHFNEEKNLNSALSPSLVHPFHDITNDVRKVSIALFLTEVLHSLLKEGAYSPLLYTYLESSITLFDEQKFNSNFHLFFLANLLPYLGIEPKKNYSKSNPKFCVHSAQFVSDSKYPIYDNNISYAFYQLLGTEIDASSIQEIVKNNKNELIELLFNYLRIHFQFNAEKIKSHKVLKTIFH